MNCDYFEIKNFSKYQHYSNRNPPWVRLYYSILDDPEFIALSEVDRSRYLALTLVASRCANRVKNDAEYLKKMLRIDSKPDLTNLFNSGFLLASRKRSATSKRKQNQTTEESISEESSTEVQSSTDKTRKRSVASECPTDFELTDQRRVYANSKGIDDVDGTWEHFRSHHEAKGSKFKNWDAAWRTWCLSPLQKKGPQGLMEYDETGISEGTETPSS